MSLIVLCSRGDAGFQIAKLFENIREAAKASGGTVVSLYGNHEFMNLYGTHTFAVYWHP